jgi:glycosyltransferase involved in cell wall biosynthesis
MYCGELNWTSLIALCKKATTFIHLAYLDHCPNVVVDAQAAGCKVVCSSTGGTPEIIENGIIVHEEAWDFKPCRLYEPPVLKFNNIVEVTDPKDRNIVNCSERYYNIFKGIL